MCDQSFDWDSQKLIGGHPAVDFANTVGGAGKARDEEWLNSYDAALDWCVKAHIVTAKERAVLVSQFNATPDKGNAALRELQMLRDAVFACLNAEDQNATWPIKSHKFIEAMIADSVSHATLRRYDKTFTWMFSVERDGLRLPMRRISMEVEHLLRNEDLDRLRSCDRCSWLFISKGRGKPRRWCSMDTCGSRDKASRYYHRRVAR